MDPPRDPSRLQAVALEHCADAVQNPAGEVRAVSEDLADVDPAAAGEHDVGERAADVDPEREGRRAMRRHRSSSSPPAPAPPTPEDRSREPPLVR